MRMNEKCLYFKKKKKSSFIFHSYYFVYYMHLIYDITKYIIEKFCHHLLNRFLFSFFFYAEQKIRYVTCPSVSSSIRAA